MPEPLTQRRAEIAQAALDLAFTAGPDRVTTGMIATQLGLSQPAIYKHFPRKEDIWIAIADLLGQRIADNITDAATRPPGLPRLRQLVQGHLALVTAAPALPDIMIMRDPDAKRGPVQPRMMQALASMRAALVENIGHAIDQGDIRPEIDKTDAATLIIGLIQSLILRMLISRNPAILLADGPRLLALLLSGFSMKGGD